MHRVKIATDIEKKQKEHRLFLECRAPWGNHLNLNLFYKTLFFIFFQIVIIHSASGLSANDAIKAVQSENIVVKFESNSPQYKGLVLTSIRGVGHAPYKLQLVTFRMIDKKIKVFAVEYQGPQQRQNSLKSIAATDRPYPEADFYYEIQEGELDSKTYNSLVVELAKIHHMKTFKEYKVSVSDPISFEAIEKEFSGTGTGYGSSSSNFVSIVNLWDAPKNGFLYEIAGYSSTDIAQQAVKVSAMNLLIEKIIQKTTLKPIKVISAEHRDIFHHQWTILKINYNGKFWWWVKERTIALASILGDKRMINDLIREFKTQTDKNKNAKEPDDTEKTVQLRLRRLSATALAKISGKDFRFDTNGAEQTIEETGKLYLKEFSISSHE